MNSMIAIDAFDAKYIVSDDDGTRRWQPCRIVGLRSGSTATPWMVALVNYKDGTIMSNELSEAYDVDAEMPPARRSGV